MKEIFSDVAAQKDLLGRDEFAKDIAFTLLNSLPDNSESIVLGLNGRWGSGKSTLLNLIINALKEGNKDDERMIIYNDFNPWMFSGQEALQKEFLRGLKVKFEKNGWLKKSFEKIIEKTTQGLDAYQQGLGTSISNIFDDKSILKLKENVDALIQKENIRLFIFIDDLDRLTPDEIIQIFQLVKLNANFKNTVFIIAYDADIVQMALEKHYGENGKRYLSKIVQVDYTIPEMTIDEIGNTFFRHLKSFIETHSINYNPNNFIKVWDDKKLKNYFTTLRDVYRYFNALLFRLPKIKDEINVEHFLILEAVRVFDFPSYQSIYLLSKQNMSDHGILTPLRDENKIEIKNLTSLYLTRYLFSSSQHSMGFSNNSRKEISDRMYFENYFSLKVTAGNVTDKEFRDFMTVPQQREGIFNSVIKHGRLEAFLRRLTNSDIAKQYVINDSHLFRILLDSFDRNDKLLEDYGFKLFYALMNLAYNFENSSEGYQELIDTSCNDMGYLHKGNIWMLFWFYLDIRDSENLTSETPEYRKLLFRNKDKIMAFLETSFGSWKSYPFYCRETHKHRHFKKQFIQDLARLCPKKYLEEFEEVLKDSGTKFKVLILVLESMLLLDSVNKKAIKIDGELCKLLLPNSDYENQFVETVKKVKSEYWDLLDDSEKNNIDFFLKKSISMNLGIF